MRNKTQQNYAANFGIQWNYFSKTQLDSFSGVPISRDRLFRTTKWPTSLKGQRILEAGCGAGRFSEILLACDAEVYSFDLSDAVFANRRNNGDCKRLHLLMASIYDIPFKREAFDKVLCLGVLQHCPDVEAAFISLLPFLKPGGEIVVDVYDAEYKRPDRNPAYRIRTITSRMNPKLLFRLVKLATPFMLQAKRAVKRIRKWVPYLGFLYGWIPVFDYRGELPLSELQVREWAFLDTFDFLGARYDQPQHIDAVREWFIKAGLDSIDISKGGNGIIGRGKKGTAGSLST